MDKMLIIIHASSGGVALLAGMISIISDKGKNIHKKSGLVFYYSMLTSAISALVIAVLPGHFNMFLFSIGIFSAYFVISGRRALNFRNAKHDFLFDKVLAILLLVTSIGMIVLPIVLQSVINIVLLIFGITGLIFSIRDIVQMRDKKKLRKKWLPTHLGKITGGYISALTAFIVVNNLLPGIIGWIAPGVFGGVFIAYWIRKISKAKVN